jgi:4a-hydroxytetrahydrobiopterin dehydratase
MKELASRELIPPRGGSHQPLKGVDLQEIYTLLGNAWSLVEDHHLEREYGFKDFQTALDFTNQVGALAEEVDHHPEICLTWGRAKVTLWTHSLGGLSEADFIFAARCDQLAQPLNGE